MRRLVEGCLLSSLVSNILLPIGYRGTLELIIKILVNCHIYSLHSNLSKLLHFTCIFTRMMMLSCVNDTLSWCWQSLSDDSSFNHCINTQIWLLYWLFERLVSVGKYRGPIEKLHGGSEYLGGLKIKFFNKVIEKIIEN